MRATIIIENWCKLLVDHAWRFERKVTWAEYVEMSKRRDGEGSTWRALL